MRLGTPNTTVESNLDPANTRACGFDADGAAHIMSILSNMYSNAPLAVLREYACNARDSHVAAGNPAPIEVTLPTPLSPTLVVRDYGVGLSTDEIVGVYANYGASTKRDRDDQVGAFGIGSKSAYTIGQQFVVTAVKDGTQTAALFTIGDDDMAAYQILSTTDTHEPNGVTVSIAVDEPAAWERIAERFFATWEPGTVLVNGTPPASIHDQGVRLSDRTHLPALDTETPEGMTVVMGNVGYPVSASIANRIVAAEDATIQVQLHRLARVRAHLRVDIGEVDITPSREGLRDTPKTLKRVRQAMYDAITDAAATISREVEHAPTITKAALAYCRAKGHVTALLPPSYTPSWRGQPLASKIVTRHPLYSRLGRGRQRTECDNDGEVYLDHRLLAELLVVTGVPHGKTMTVARGVRRIVDHSDTIRRVMASPHDHETLGWFAYGTGSPVATMTFEDYRAKAKELAPPRGHSRGQTRYTVLYGTTEDQLTATEILALGCKVLLYPSPTPLTAVSQHVREGKVAVFLARGQTLDAARRRMPKAKLGPDAEKAFARRTVKAMTTDDNALLNDILAARAVCDGERLYRLLGEHLDQITNPDVFDPLATVDKVRDLSTEQSDRAALLFDALRRSGQDPSQPTPINLTEKYPLLDAGLRHSCRPSEQTETVVEHTIAYLNAAA